MPIEQRKDVGTQLTVETWAVNPIAGTQSADQTFNASVPGSWLLTDVLLVVPPAGGSGSGQLPANMSISHAWVVSADVIGVRFVNEGTGTVTPGPNLLFTVVVFRR